MDASNPWLVRSRRTRLARVEHTLVRLVHALQPGGIGPGCRGAHRPDVASDLSGGDRQRLIDDAVVLLRLTEGLSSVRRVARTRYELARLVHAPLRLDERSAALEATRLRRRWWDRADGPDERPMLLADPADLLIATPREVAQLCHDVALAHGVGHRPDHLDLDDAELALAVALEHDDLELIAQALWLWPMLGLAWSAPAVLAARLLDEAQDELGASVPAALAHAILGAAVLQHPFPRAPRPVHGRPRVVQDGGRRWEAARERMEPGALVAFQLSVYLRRACAGDDVTAVRVTLDLARTSGLTDRPAVRQADAWLRRHDVRERGGWGRVADVC